MPYTTETGARLNTGHLYTDEDLNAVINAKIDAAFFERGEAGEKTFDFGTSPSFVIPFPGNGTIESEDDKKQYVVAVLPAAAMNARTSSAPAHASARRAPAFITGFQRRPAPSVRMSFAYCLDKDMQEKPPERHEVEVRADTSASFQDHRRDVFDDLADCLKAHDVNIKILFPYNLTNHWNTAEIRIHKTGHQFKVICRAIDPYSSGQFSAENQREIKVALNKKIKQHDPSANISISFAADNEYACRQFDGTSCGPISAEDLIHRIYGRSLTTRYPSGASALRTEHLDFLAEHIGTDNATFENFQRRVTTRVGAPGAARSKSESDSSPISVAAPSARALFAKLVAGELAADVTPYLDVLEKMNVYGVPAKRLLMTDDPSQAKDLALRACQLSLPKGRLIPHAYINATQAKLAALLGFSLEGLTELLDHASAEGLKPLEGQTIEAQHELLWAYLWHYTLAAQFDGQRQHLAALSLLQLFLGNIQLFSILEDHEAALQIQDFTKIGYFEEDAEIERYLLESFVLKQGTLTDSQVALLNDVLPDIAKALFKADSNIIDVYRLAEFIVRLCTLLEADDAHLKTILSALNSIKLADLKAMAQHDIQFFKRLPSNWSAEKIVAFSVDADNKINLPALAFCLTDNARRILSTTESMPAVLASGDTNAFALSAGNFHESMASQSLDSMMAFFEISETLSRLGIDPAAFQQSNSKFLTRLGKSVNKLDDYALHLCHLSHGFFNLFSDISAENFQDLYVKAVKEALCKFLGVEDVSLADFVKSLNFMRYLKQAHMHGLYRCPDLSQLNTVFYLSHHLTEAEQQTSLRCYSSLAGFVEKLQITAKTSSRDSATQLQSLKSSIRQKQGSHLAPAATVYSPSTTSSSDLSIADTANIEDLAFALPILTQEQAAEFERYLARVKQDGKPEAILNLLKLQALQAHPVLAQFFKCFDFAVIDISKQRYLDNIKAVCDAYHFSSLGDIFPLMQQQSFGDILRFTSVLQALRLQRVVLTPEEAVQFAQVSRLYFQTPLNRSVIEISLDFIKDAICLGSLDRSELTWESLLGSLQNFGIMTLNDSLQTLNEQLSQSDDTYGRMSNWHSALSANLFLALTQQSQAKHVATLPFRLRFHLGYVHMIAHCETTTLEDMTAFMKSIANGLHHQTIHFDDTFLGAFSLELSEEALPNPRRDLMINAGPRGMSAFALATAWYCEHFLEEGSLPQLRLMALLDKAYTLDHWQNMPKDAQAYMRAFFEKTPEVFQGQAICTFLNPSEAVQPVGASIPVSYFDGLGDAGFPVVAPLPDAPSQQGLHAQLPDLGGAGNFFGFDPDGENNPEVGFGFNFS